MRENRTKQVGERRGFTLVEMMIVIVILATLAGLVIPYFADTSLEARIIATQNILRTTGTAIDLYRVRYTRPNYPPTVMGSWFMTKVVPPNPMAMDGTTTGTVEVVNIANATNPSNRTIGTGISHYWYNAANGVIRARVQPQETSALTTSLYNTVNSTGGMTVIVTPSGGPIKDVGDGGALEAF